MNMLVIIKGENGVVLKEFVTKKDAYMWIDDNNYELIDEHISAIIKRSIMIVKSR